MGGVFVHFGSGKNLFSPRWWSYHIGETKERWAELDLLASPKNTLDSLPFFLVPARPGLVPRPVTSNCHVQGQYRLVQTFVPGTSANRCVSLQKKMAQVVTNPTRTILKDQIHFFFPKLKTPTPHPRPQTFNPKQRKFQTLNPTQEPETSESPHPDPQDHTHIVDPYRPNPEP